MKVIKDLKQSGYVFNIQHYSLHDGDGIRTVVFMKGCPLRCKWCSNPESQKIQPELAFYKSRCIGISDCSFCIEQCCSKAIKVVDDQISISRSHCRKCFQCTQRCPSNAIKVWGRLNDIGEILDIVEKDSYFYTRSNGGLTLSGGEPLAQAEFSISMLKEAKKRYLHTAMETCGYAKWEELSQAAEYLDAILYDIKCVNEEKHLVFTGVSNSLILNNFTRLCAEYPDLDITVRIPVIPAFNDSKAEIDEILSYIKEIHSVKYEFLPYHQFGISKYEALGLSYPLGNARLQKGIEEYIIQANSLQN